VLGLGDDGEADGATATQTEGTSRRRPKRTRRISAPLDPATQAENPDSPPPKPPARKRSEVLYRHEDGRVACAHHAHVRPGSEHYGTGWKRISKTERLRLHNKGEAPVCEGCAKMEEKKRATAKPGLYWNERGQINCEQHIPYPGSDTWIFEHWKRIDRGSAKDAKEKGMELVCETCRAIAERQKATPTKGRRKKEDPAPKPKGTALDPNLTLGHLAGLYLDHLQQTGKSLATQFSYSMDLVVAKRVLGNDTLIANLTPERVAEYYASPEVTMRKNGKPRQKVTIDKCRRVLRLALVWAADMGLIAETPLPTTTEKA
jgi:hypothetical protein